MRLRTQDPFGPFGAYSISDKHPINSKNRMLPSQLPVANEILSALPRAAYRSLLSHMETVELEEGALLYQPGEAQTHMYFPTSSLLSLQTLVDHSETFTVALVGREGISHVCCVLGTQLSPFRTVVLSAGQALRIKVRVFAKEFRDSEVLRGAVLSYVQALIVQISENAACNRFHVIEQRLARWLLMMRDRLSIDHFHITHETMGQLLGVRRVGVTNAALALKQQGLIDYSRGAIDILDGRGLQKVACGCYHMLEGRHGKA